MIITNVISRIFHFPVQSMWCMRIKYHIYIDIIFACNMQSIKQCCLACHRRWWESTGIMITSCISYCIIIFDIYVVCVWPSLLSLIIYYYYDSGQTLVNPIETAICHSLLILAYICINVGSLQYINITLRTTFEKSESFWMILHHSQKKCYLYASSCIMFIIIIIQSWCIWSGTTWIY